MIRTTLLADFEAMIRSALANFDASDPSSRAKVYQSSRNALNRMISSNRSLTVENALTQQKALEDSIRRIEAEYLPNIDPQNSVPDVNPASSGGIEDHRIEPSIATESSSPDDFSAQPTLEDFEAARDMDHAGSLEDMDSYGQMPPEFSRRRRGQKRITFLIILLVILVLFGWGGYAVFQGLISGTLFESDPSPGITSLDPNSSQNQGSDYITILEPGDPTPLTTAERGRAQIVNELNTEMLRIVSVRNDADRLQTAKPIMLKLAPGVVQAISGKKVTIEIFAKSGGNGPATFSVECMFGNLGSCGRKRFRVGLQPEAVVFSAQLNRIDGNGADAYLAINTDISSTAELTGEGDLIDIVYARVRIGG